MTLNSEARPAPVDPVRLPHDPLTADAWGQLWTAGLMLPHVGVLVVLLIAALFAGAWGADYALHATPIHAAVSR